MQCISRHLQLTLVESALCCPCLELLFSLSSQTACTQCTFSTLPGVIVPGTGSQPSYTASSEQAPIHFTAENSMSGTVSVGDPDPHVFGPPRSGSGSISQRCGYGSGSFPFLINVLSGLKTMLEKIEF